MRSLQGSSFGVKTLYRQLNRSGTVLRCNKQRVCLRSHIKMIHFRGLLCILLLKVRLRVPLTVVLPKTTPIFEAWFSQLEMSHVSHNQLLVDLIVFCSFSLPHSLRVSLKKNPPLALAGHQIQNYFLITCQLQLLLANNNITA